MRCAESGDAAGTKGFPGQGAAGLQASQAAEETQDHQPADQPPPQDEVAEAPIVAAQQRAHSMQAPAPRPETEDGGAVRAAAAAKAAPAQAAVAHIVTVSPSDSAEAACMALPSLFSSAHSFLGSLW